MSGVQNIRVGADVLGSEGDKLGTVNQVGPDFIVVEKGFLLTKDLYIPTSAVTTVDTECRVLLSVPKDQVENMGWDQPRITDTDYPTGTTTVL